MTLKEANEKLENLLEVLVLKIPEVEKLESRYYATYDKLLLQAHYSNAEQRQSETNAMLRQDPIYEKYFEAKIEMRKLLTTKECLVEICRNLRTLENAKTRFSSNNY